MSTNSFIRADEVAKELGVSRSYAYKLIKQLILLASELSVAAALLR